MKHEKISILNRNYNCSWQHIYESILILTKRDEEDLDDILGGCIALAEERANLLDRDLLVWQDIPYTLSLFCWWPLKPVLKMDINNRLIDIRSELFTGVSRNEEKKANLIKSLSPEVLKMERHELLQVLQNNNIERIFDLEVG